MSKGYYYLKVFAKYLQPFKGAKNPNQAVSSLIFTWMHMKNFDKKYFDLDILPQPANAKVIYAGGNSPAKLFCAKVENHDYEMIPVDGKQTIMFMIATSKCFLAYSIDVDFTRCNPDVLYKRDIAALKASGAIR